MTVLAYDSEGAARPTEQLAQDSMPIGTDHLPQFVNIALYHKHIELPSLNLYTPVS